MTIAERAAGVWERIAGALERSGRRAEELVAVAATKTRTAEEILEAVEAGFTHLGENYVQDLIAKREAIDKAAGSRLSWHVIGHLQRNKVRQVVPGTALIHSVDTLRLAQEIDRRAAEAGVRQPVLLEVNLAEETTKYGVSPQGASYLAHQVAALQYVDLQGLMCMPPYAEDPEASRPCFRKLAQLARGLAEEGLPASTMRHLSMGMSGDFEVAIEEGATLIRLGTALFGPRDGP